MENILFFHCIFWNHRSILLICIHCKDIGQCGFGTCGLWENLIPKLNIPFQTYEGSPFLIVLSKLNVENNYLENIIPVSLRIFTSPSKAILFTKLLISLQFCATILGAKAEAAEKVFHLCRSCSHGTHRTWSWWMELYNGMSRGRDQGTPFGGETRLSEQRQAVGSPQNFHPLSCWTITLHHMWLRKASSSEI